MRSLVHPGVEQLLDNAVFRAIALDPVLAADEIDVDQATMLAASPVPADDHQQVIVLLAIEDGVELEVAMRIGNLGVVGQDSLDQLAVGACGIHWRIVSICGSKMINWMRRFSISNWPIGSSKRLLYTSWLTAESKVRSGSTRERTSPWIVY